MRDRQQTRNGTTMFSNDHFFTGFDLAQARLQRRFEL